MDLAQRFIKTLKILAAVKALPNSVSPPETTETITIEQPKPDEAKSRALRLACKRVDKV
jgi:hypothetical protein